MWSSGAGVVESMFDCTLITCKAMDYWDKFRDNSQAFYVLILSATDSLRGFCNAPQLSYRSAFPSEK